MPEFATVWLSTISASLPPQSGGTLRELFIHEQSPCVTVDADVSQC